MVRYRLSLRSAEKGDGIRKALRAGRVDLDGEVGRQVLDVDLDPR